MNKKFLWVPLSAMFLLSAACFASCNKEPDGKDPGGTTVETKYGLKPTEAVTFPTDGVRTTKVSVHDPSVFQDPKTNKYYAFGSHFMVASSTDLIEWEQEVGDGSSESNGQKVAQKLYGDGVNWRTVLKESVKHAGSQMPSTWAPDVNYHEGKYYMYYSLTSSFGSNKSVIGRVSSDNVLGPYANEEIIKASPGTSITQPNCIDPELFEDKDGGLWMVYGSHFGGIYMLELNNSGASWGLPKENSTLNAQNDGFGKKVWNGARNGQTVNTGANRVVEGPFVFYNNLTDYYYLMTTYGDLTSDYNMHIARSKNPDGPYVDVTGADMATLTNAGTTGGNKIAGNYKFARQGAADAYAALGHNSVIKDKDGKYFVVYHTRRAKGTDVSAGHNLCVSQMFFNEDGWPVMSPVCYESETFGTVTEAQLAETYEVVIHASETTVNLTSSVDYELTADKKVMKGSDEAGTWSLKDGYYLTLTIDGKEYKGVVVPGWDMYASTKEREGRLCISAVSNEGVSLWAIAGKI